MNKLQEKIEQYRAYIDELLNEIPSDDLFAQEQAACLVIDFYNKLEAITFDERPKCDCCGERKDWAAMANNDLCLHCDADRESELAAREDSYQAYINR